MERGTPTEPTQPGAATWVALGVAVAVLGGAAALKLVGLLHPTRWLAQPNPVLPFSEGTVLWLAVALDLAVVGYLLWERSLAARTAALVTLVALFTVYRGALWWSGASRHCGCLGDPASWWPWLATHQDAVGLVAFGALVMATVTMVAILRIGHNNVESRST